MKKYLWNFLKKAAAGEVSAVRYIIHADNLQMALQEEKSFKKRKGQLIYITTAKVEKCVTLLQSNKISAHDSTFYE